MPLRRESYSDLEKKVLTLDIVDSFDVFRKMKRIFKSGKYKDKVDRLRIQLEKRKDELYSKYWKKYSKSNSVSDQILLMELYLDENRLYSSSNFTESESFKKRKKEIFDLFEKNKDAFYDYFKKAKYDTSHNEQNSDIIFDFIRSYSAKSGQKIPKEFRKYKKSTVKDISNSKLSSLEEYL